MNRRPDQERLLTDVLVDAEDAAFREQLFSETLKLARRRRAFRQMRRATGGIAVIICLILLAWQFPHPLSIGPVSKDRGYAIVHTRPLPSASLVTSQPLAPSRLVATGPSVPIVQTVLNRGQVREIDDGELLSLVGSKPAALVRLGNHSAELVFVNAADEEELLRN